MAILTTISGHFPVSCFDKNTQCNFSSDTTTRQVFVFFKTYQKVNLQENRRKGGTAYKKLRFLGVRVEANKSNQLLCLQKLQSMGYKAHQDPHHLCQRLSVSSSADRTQALTSLGESKAEYSREHDTITAETQPVQDEIRRSTN